MMSKNKSTNKNKNTNIDEKKKYRTVLTQHQLITVEIPLEVLFGEEVDLSKNHLSRLEFNELIDNKTIIIHPYFDSKTEN